MAIISAIPGLEVEIVSNGQSCAEFDIVDGDGDGTPAPQGNEVAVKYARVEEGSIFEVHVHIGKRYPHHNCDLLVTITVGGVEVKRTVYKRLVAFSSSNDTTKKIWGITSRAINGQAMTRRFKFHSTVAGKFYYFLAFNHCRK
jgi:hypothetical protein